MLDLPKKISIWDTQFCEIGWKNIDISLDS